MCLVDMNIELTIGDLIQMGSVPIKRPKEPKGLDSMSGNMNSKEVVGDVWSLCG